MQTAHISCLACLLTLSAAHAQTCPPDRLGQPLGLTHSFAGKDFEIEGDHLVFGDGGAFTGCPIPDPFTCTAGAVFAYRWEGGRWVQVQMVVPDDLGRFDGFGTSLDIDGDRMLVTTGLKGLDGRFGLLHDFRFDHGSGQWVEVGRAAAPGTGLPREGFGISLAFEGTLALTRQANLVHRYTEGAGGWEYRDSFSAPDGMEDGAFGHEIIVREGWVFITAHADSSASSPTRHGSVYVFRRHADDTLEFHQKLLPAGIGAGRTLAFGTEIAQSGSTLAISHGSASPQFDYQGAVLIYELEGDQWTLKQELTHSDAGRTASPGVPAYPCCFGRGLSMDGDTLVASPRLSPFYYLAYLFRRGGDGVWREVAVLEPGDATPPGWRGEGFGSGSDVEGNRLVVAAREESLSSSPFTRGGAAYAFDLECIICEPDLDADGALTIFDFLTFLNHFQDGDLQADFDGDGELTIFDFLAFQDAFDEGCA